MSFKTQVVQGNVTKTMDVVLVCYFPEGLSSVSRLFQTSWLIFRRNGLV